VEILKSCTQVKINSWKEDDHHHIGLQTKILWKKTPKYIGIVFWVKFRQMTIIFLQIGEIFSVVWVFLVAKFPKKLHFFLNNRQILSYAPLAGSQK